MIPAPDKIGLTEMPPEMKNFIIPKKAGPAAPVVPFAPPGPPLPPSDLRSAA